MSDYIKEETGENNRFADQTTSSDNIPETADAIRRDLEIEIDWFAEYRDPEMAFNFLWGRIETLGILVIKNGRTQYTDVYELTGTTGNTFREMIARVGIADICRLENEVNSISDGI